MCLFFTFIEENTFHFWGYLILLCGLLCEAIDDLFHLSNYLGKISDYGKSTSKWQKMEIKE